MSTTEFVYVSYIQATPEELYASLTEWPSIERYMGGWGPVSDWQVGSVVRWQMGPDSDAQDLGQKVLEAEPGKRLTYTWHTLQPMHRELFDTDEEFAAALGERSTVSFAIEPGEVVEAGTKLTLTHGDFDSPDSKMLEGTSGGWVMIVSALKTQLEGGRRLDGKA
ncbi:SRPBCC domain-containing protein [Streptomyces beijiangensis]|uniref:SRPBCC domain-containing protein n=1 Tax=Streptomyces beijiangensis TaxID=163361 RepID=A0A939F689_9ACTN|nr:SRPBCC domain-containing protein [Streptomyces beijiangensis]MBO0512279.1 SRPBCC domain-containing protein [Streptomyces beijiangensis]